MYVYLIMVLSFVIAVLFSSISLFLCGIQSFDFDSCSVMSIYTQPESVTPGCDTVIDSYLGCLWNLKDKVMTLIHQYHLMLLQKMECDLGNLVTCNTDSFRNQLTDVFAQLNEVEVQLNGLEAWSGLPPECFAPISSTSPAISLDPDQISLEAQTLVELVRRLQLGLRSMVNTSSIQPSASTSVGDAVQIGDTGKPTKTVTSSLPKRNPPTPTLSSNRLESHLPMVHGAGALPGLVSSQSGFTTVPVQLSDTVPYSITEDSTSMVGNSHFVYKSSGAPSVMSTTTRSPMTDRRHLDPGEAYANFPSVGKSSTGPSSYTSMTVPPYEQTTVTSYPFASSNPTQELVSLAPPGRIAAGSYIDPITNQQTSTRADYLIQNTSIHKQCYKITPYTCARLPSPNSNNLLTFIPIFCCCGQCSIDHTQSHSYVRSPLWTNPADLGLRYSSSFRSPKSWEHFGVDPERAGTQTIYRDLRPQFDHQTHLPRRIIPVPHCGGSGGVPDQEPYLQPKPTNLRYNPRLYEGGLLPRLEHTDEPVRLPEYRPRDKWAPHRAHFGQNDYIDLLGDGDLGPRDFYTGPTWILGARNEFQRVCARVNNPAIVAWMEEFEPSRLKLEQKNQRYLYKKVNKRKNIKFLKYRDSP
ncbi:hypothetical protein PHET_03916 [Paragonimus heterotremus]|uniref:Large ribosomal subunit protein mL51 n=1 Tax=Paragonimus heterotremus TaxID=100268 RepID=A0A8J4SQU6_9TREM|nr:hypothetical protein PHET_03916 [Paragonimus heterotremus]